MEKENHISSLLSKWLSDSSDAEKLQVFNNIIEKKKIEYRDKSTNTPNIAAQQESSDNEEIKNGNHEKLINFVQPYFCIPSLSSEDSKMNKFEANLTNPANVTNNSDDSIIKNLITEKYKNRLNGNQKRRFAHTIQKCRRIEDVNRIMNVKKFNSISLKKTNTNIGGGAVQNEDENDTTIVEEKTRSEKKKPNDTLLDDFEIKSINCEEISQAMGLPPIRSPLEPHDDQRLNSPSNMTNYSDFPDEDISTSRVSTLLSLTPQFPNRINPNYILPSSTLNNDPYEDSSNSSSSKDESLITEASFQHEVISQVTKALTMCSFGRNVTRPYLEAEKLLLLSMHKRDIVLREIHKTEYDITADELLVCGEVAIKNLRFSSKKCEPNQWYTLVAIGGAKVLMTEIVSPDERGNIIFSDVLKFDKLENDFQVLLKLYYLKEEEANTSCPHKIKQFFKLCKKSSSPRRGSSFMLWGTSTILISNLESKSLILNQTSINKEFLITISSELKIKGIFSGFLTIGCDVNGILRWNRFWCRLEGFYFKYYNYPQQENYTSCIDLRYCINAQISNVKREKCARPRTLQLITAREPRKGDKNSSTVIIKPHYTILMYFLSTDNLKDMDLWQKNLNIIIGALRNWNKMKFSLSFTNQEECFI